MGFSSLTGSVCLPLCIFGQIVSPLFSFFFFSSIYSSLLSVFSLELIRKERKEKTHSIGRILMNGWLIPFILFFFL